MVYCNICTLPHAHNVVKLIFPKLFSYAKQVPTVSVIIRYFFNVTTINNIIVTLKFLSSIITVCHNLAIANKFTSFLFLRYVHLINLLTIFYTFLLVYSKMTLYNLKRNLGTWQRKLFKIFITTYNLFLNYLDFR